MLVLKDPYSDALVQFVQKNLGELKIEARFIDSTESFFEAGGAEQSHVLVIGSEWQWMLEEFASALDRPSLLIVGSDLEPY